MNDLIPATGGIKSKYDSRTITHGAMAGTPLIQGGIDYAPEDILHQHKIGKCTAISLIQNAEKALGKKFSDDFQFLLQKKFYDKDWYEGSSVFNALKVGKTYGFLPAELWTHTNVLETTTWSEYVAQLQAIPDAEIQRLVGLCTDKLTGYAQVANDPQAIAQAISDSKTGVLCLLTSGSTWWTALDGHSSWTTADLEATGSMRVPTQSLSGHAIIASKFDYRYTNLLSCPNTWGTIWDDANHGVCHLDLNKYKLFEIWIPYYAPLTVDIQKKIVVAQLSLIDLLKQLIINLKNQLGIRA